MIHAELDGALAQMRSRLDALAEAAWTLEAADPEATP